MSTTAETSPRRRPGSPALIAIRPARTDDVPAIYALEDPALSTAHRPFRLREAVAEGGCWIAQLENRTVGYMIFRHCLAGRGLVTHVFTHPDDRRRGVATALLREAERHCRTGRIFAATPRSSRPMRALLAHLGYRESDFLEDLTEEDPAMILTKPIASHRD